MVASLHYILVYKCKIPHHYKSILTSSHTTITTSPTAQTAFLCPVEQDTKKDSLNYMKLYVHTTTHHVRYIHTMVCMPSWDTESLQNLHNCTQLGENSHHSYVRDINFAKFCCNTEHEILIFKHLSRLQKSFRFASTKYKNNTVDWLWHNLTKIHANEFTCGIREAIHAQSFHNHETVKPALDNLWGFNVETTLQCSIDDTLLYFTFLELLKYLAKYYEIYHSLIIRIYW